MDRDRGRDQDAEPLAVAVGDADADALAERVHGEDRDHDERADVPHRVLEHGHPRAAPRRAPALVAARRLHLRGLLPPRTARSHRLSRTGRREQPPAPAASDARPTGDRAHLDQESVQVRAYRGARRVRCPEHLAIRLVELRPVVDVGEVCGDGHHVLERRVGAREHGAQVLEHLSRLRGDAFGHLAGARILWHLPRHEQQVARADRG